MNSFEPIDPALVDYFPDEHDGYPDELAHEDTPDNLFAAGGEASREFPQELWIEPEDWEDKARDNDKYCTWPVNYIDRYTNQSPTHECTCHSESRAFEGARNKQRGINFEDGPVRGRRYRHSATGSIVWVSPLSIYAEANPRIRGGANVRQVVEIAARRGHLPETIQPSEYNFEHALHGTQGKGNSNQSSGPWVPLNRFPEGWQKTAALFKPKELVYPTMWEQAICLVLQGYFVGVGRNGHAVPWGRWHPREQKMAYPDSYDITRYDSFRTVKSSYRGSFAILSVTTPDDWSKPGE